MVFIHRVGQGVRKVESAEVASPRVSPVARASPPAAAAAAAAAAPDKPAASERERLRQREQERRRREAVSIAILLIIRDFILYFYYSCGAPETCYVIWITR